MKILFDPSGTHVHHDQLKIRVNLVPEADLNPSLNLLVYVGQDITKALLIEWISDVLTESRIATISSIMAEADPGHSLNGYMRRKNILSTAKTTTFDAQMRETVNNLLSGIAIDRIGGDIEPVDPGSINLGYTPFNGTQTTGRSGLVAQANPSTIDGAITAGGVWLSAGPATNGHFIAAYGSGSFTSRDYEAVGAIAAGSAQWFYGLDIELAIGDYIAAWVDPADTERGTSGTGDGFWYQTIAAPPWSSASFYGPVANTKVAIGGIGEIPSGPQGSIPSKMIGGGFL